MEPLQLVTIAKAVGILAKIKIEDLTKGGEAAHRMFENLHVIQSIKTEVTEDSGKTVSLEHHAFIFVESMKHAGVCREDCESYRRECIQPTNRKGDSQLLIPLRVGICNWCGKEDPGG